MRSNSSFSACAIGAMFRACALLVAKFTVFTVVMLVFSADNSCASLISMIDPFNATNGNVLFVYPGSPPQSDLTPVNVTDSDFTGVYRSRNLVCYAGNSISFTSVNLNSSGTLDFAEGPGTKAALTVTWDGASGPDTYSLGANLTTGGATGLATDIVSIDYPMYFRVEVHADANNYAYYEGVLQANVTGPQYVSFAHIDLQTVGTGVNYSSVGSIKFFLDASVNPGYPDTDLSINYVATATPEPAIYLLILSGLIWLGLGALWRKS